MKDWFDSYSQLLAEAETLASSIATQAKERNIIHAFYNGQPVMEETEAQESGQSSLINHLFGWSSMSRAQGRIESPMNQPTTWRLIIPSAPPEHKEHWESSLSDKLCELIRESGRLATEIKSLSGDATLIGRGCLAFTNLYDWCPSFVNPLVPHGAKASTNDLPYFITPGTLSRVNLEEALVASRKESSNWNTNAIEQAITAMRANASSGSSLPTGSTTGTTPEEQQDAKTQSTDVATMRRLKLPVYFCYISNPSSTGNPWDLVIIPRYSAGQRESVMKSRTNASEPDLKLYHGKSIFKNVNQVIHAMFLEANIGGEVMWHSAIGMGRLSFESDQDFEDGFNTMQDSMREAMRRLYRVSPGADREAIERFLSETKNLLPEGVDLVEQGSLPNYQHILQALTILSDHSNKLASAATGNSDKFSDELQIQAVERQQEQQEMLTRRMAGVYAFYRSLGAEIVRRFLCAPIIEDVDGYDEIEEFRSFAKKLVGEEIFGKLCQEKNGRLTNIKIKVNRSAGDGDPAKAVMGNRNLLSQAHRFGPESQQEILRSFVATETGDVEKAERLVPRAQDSGGIQAQLAMAENGNAALFSASGSVMPKQNADLDLKHIPVHFQAMQGLLNIGQQNNGWSVDEYHQFNGIGAHVAIHVQSIAAIPEQKQLAVSLSQQLQTMSRQGQEFANNLQAKMQSQQDEVSMMDRHSMSLDEARLALDTRKQDALEQNRAATQDHRERDLAFRQQKEAAVIAQKDQDSRVKADLAATQQVIQANKPNTKQTS